MSTFWENLGKSLTGETKTDLSKQALDIQQQIAKDTLAAEIESQRLKYNPLLSQQRTIQIALVSIPVVILIGVFIYFKFIR